MRSSIKSEWWSLAWIILLTLWFYSPIRKAGFVYDDWWYLVNNPAVRTWDIGAFFKQHSTAAAPGSGLEEDVYRPLGTLEYVAAYHAWGQNPLPYHLLGLLLHIVNGLLLFGVLGKILSSRPGAIFGTLIFLWHPAQVQSVAWVAQLTGLLAMTGFLVSLRCFLEEETSIPKMLLGWAAFAVAGFTKETVLVLPLVMVLLWKKAGNGRRWFGRGILAILFVYLACRQAALGHLSQFAHGAGPWIESVAMGLLAFPIYLGKILWPIALRASYGYPLLLDPWKVGAAAILLAAYIAAALRLRRSAPLVSQALGWVLAALLPFLGLIPIRAFFAERFLYVPMAGVALLAGWAWQEKHLWRPSLALWLVFLAVQSVRAVPAWQNEQSLWRNAALLEPTNAFAHACYAQTLGDTPAAEQEYLQVLVNSPSEGLRYAAYQNLAALNHKWRRTWEAQYWKAKAEKAKPAG